MNQHRPSQAVTGGDVTASFVDWLERQADRTDPVGDLARDVVHDRRVNRVALETLADVRTRMTSLGASAAALEALEAAVDGWAGGE